jgi:hypothetical protein
LILLKMEQIERLEKQIAVGQTFLMPARAG